MDPLRLRNSTCCLLQLLSANSPWPWSYSSHMCVNPWIYKVQVSQVMQQQQGAIHRPSQLFPDSTDSNRNVASLGFLLTTQLLILPQLLAWFLLQCWRKIHCLSWLPGSHHVPPPPQTGVVPFPRAKFWGVSKFWLFSRGPIFSNSFHDITAAKLSGKEMRAETINHRKWYNCWVAADFRQLIDFT